jgi:hypothetical protein
VPGRLDEIQTAMNPVINNFLSVDATLLFKVCIKTRINVVDDWLPTVEEVTSLSRKQESTYIPVMVIDKVTKSRGVYNSQTQAYTVFLDVYRGCQAVDGSITLNSHQR